jgi:hypothetical protein
VTTTSVPASPERLEGLLREAFAAELPPGLAAQLDERISSAVERQLPWSRHRAGPGLPRRRATRMPPPGRVFGHRPRRAVLFAVVVPLLLVVIAVTAIGHAPSPGFFQVGSYPWRNAQQLDMTETVDGYQVTLESVYADVNRLVVAIGVSDLDKRGWSAIRIGRLEVTDSAGVDWEVETATSDPGPTSAEGVFVLEPSSGPVPDGPRDLTFALTTLDLTGAGTSRQVDIDVTFTTTIDVRGGKTVSGLAPATRDGVTVTIDRVVIAPSMVEIDLRWDGLPTAPPDTSWMPTVELRHDGSAFDSFSGGGPISGSRWVERTAQGAEDPAGHWTVTITAFWYDRPDANGTGARMPARTTFPGPWLFEFDVP